MSPTHVTLSWTAEGGPVGAEGGPVGGYRMVLTATGDHITLNLPAAARRYTLERLAPGTHVQAWLTCLSPTPAIAPSDAAKVDVWTPGPSRPIHLSLRRRAAGSVALFWGPIEMSGGAKLVTLILRLKPKALSANEAEGAGNITLDIGPACSGTIAHLPSKRIYRANIEAVFLHDETQHTLVSASIDVATAVPPLPAELYCRGISSTHMHLFWLPARVLRGGQPLCRYIIRCGGVRVYEAASDVTSADLPLPTGSRVVLRIEARTDQARVCAVSKALILPIGPLLGELRLDGLCT